jgi:hypothetical protein
VVVGSGVLARWLPKTNSSTKSTSSVFPVIVGDGFGGCSRSTAGTGLELIRHAGIPDRVSSAHTLPPALAAPTHHA